MPIDFNKLIRESTDPRQVIRASQRAQACRNAASTRPVNHNTERCPGCDQGLKARVLEHIGATLLVCPNCNWSTTLPYMLDRAREMGTAYVPGVTGKPRGTTVVFDQSGKIKEIR